MTAIARFLARNGRKGGRVQSEAKVAASKARAAKLWEDRRAGRAPLPLFRRYLDEPCLDAFQIGAQADGTAVWERRGQVFRVAWRDNDSFQLFAVREDQIARRHERPIPWAEIAGQEGGTA